MIKKKNAFRSLVLVGLALASFNAVNAAFADTLVAAAESSAGSVIPDATTNATIQIPSSSSALDRFYLNYFGTYHGNTLSDVGASHTVTQTGAPSAQSVYFDSEVTAAYMITPTIGIGPDVPFYLVPVKGQGGILQDVGIKTFDRQLISYNGFNLYMNLIIQAPTSDYSRGRGETVGFKTTPAIRYVFPASRVSIGAWTELKEYAGVTSGKAFKTYAAPYVNYLLLPNFSLNLEYEMEADRMVGNPGLNLTNYGTDLLPGFIWNITPKVFVNPYLVLYTGNHVNSDSTAIGALISATVL